MDRITEKEWRREELSRLLEADEKLKTRLERDYAREKIFRKKDFVRTLELERREATLNGVVLKAQEVATLQKNQIKQEEKLAVELDLIRRQEIVDEKLRLHLRENSHELKELESQLRIAYVNKVIATQLAEKEANRLEEQIKDRRAREILEKAVGNLDKQEEDLRINEIKTKEKLRKSLQDQIIEKERLRQQEFIAFLNEKKLCDDILKKIQEEEARELEDKKFLQQKQKEEMEQFNRAREIWKAKERLTVQEEEEKIKQINEEKERTTAEIQMKKKGKQDKSDQVYGKLVKEMMENKKLMEEREELLSLMVWNDWKEKEDKKAQEELVQEMARKEEARTAYYQLLAEKSRKKREEKELDEKFAHLMKAKLEEEDRKEKEKQEQRRKIQISNRKYNEEAMRRNVEKRAEGLKLTQLINALEEEKEKKKAEMIEEERIRLLKEHAPKLSGYFPKGCLKKEDLVVLGLAGNSSLPKAEGTCPADAQ